MKVGNSKSCGCGNKEDLTNKKFNLLTALERLPNYKSKRTYYKCVCDCNNYRIVEGSKLVNNRIKSCGRKCLIWEHKNKGRRKPIIESAINRLYSDYKRNAKNRNLCFLLTKEEVTKLVLGNCFYCGRLPYKDYAKTQFPEGVQLNGIDRKNNSEGYILENSLSCCTQCNYIKSSLNIEDFLFWLDLVFNNLKISRQ